MDFVTIIVSVALIWMFAVWWRRSSKETNLPPSPRGIPFIGNWEIVKRNPRTLRDLGAICTLHLFGKKFVVINDWKILKEALVTQSNVFAGRSRFHVQEILNGDTDILSNDGPLWKEKRRFAIHTLRDLGFGKTTMENVIMDEISKLMQIIDNSVDKQLEITGLFFMPTVNIGWSLISGKKYRYDDEIIKQLTYLIKSRIELVCDAMPVNGLPCLRYLPKDPFGYWKLLRMGKPLQGYLKAELDEHVSTFQVGSEPRDYIDAYLAEIYKRKIALKTDDEKQSAPYNEAHLLGTMSNFLMAGIDTISSNLEWSILYMGVWPEIQKKVQVELDNVIGQNRIIQYGDASSLPYTEATLLEVHRYATIVPLALPHRVTETTKLATYTIPKNTTVIPNLWASHYDNVWGDPEIFRPERFLDTSGKVLKPDNWIPFSIGSRSCPGIPLAKMQVFLFFATLLQRFSFNCVTGEAPPSLDPLTMKSVTATPRPFRMKINRR